MGNEVQEQPTVKSTDSSVNASALRPSLNEMQQHQRQQTDASATGQPASGGSLDFGSHEDLYKSQQSRPATDSTPPNMNFEETGAIRQMMTVINNPDRVKTTFPAPEYDGAVYGNDTFYMSSNGVNKVEIKSGETANAGAAKPMLEATWNGRSAMPDGGRLVLWHSHPDIHSVDPKSGLHYEPNVLSANDVQQANMYGETMVLAPNGEVIALRGKMENNMHPVTEKEQRGTVVGRFDKEGNFVPYKQTADGKNVPDPTHTIYRDSPAGIGH